MMVYTEGGNKLNIKGCSFWEYLINLEPNSLKAELNKGLDHLEFSFPDF